MNYFTTEEFNIMIEELTSPSGCRYDMMISIADKILYNRIRSKCYNSALKGGDHHEDIMQIIRMKLVRGVVTSFLKRTNTINTNEDWFRSWVITVGDNAFKDYLRKNTRELPGYEDEIVIESEDFYGESFIVILETFNKVLKCRYSPHIILAWIHIILVMYTEQVTKIQANHIVEKRFSNRTLDDMMKVLDYYVDNIEWLKPDRDLLDKQRVRLDKLDDSGKRLGDMLFGSFFMKQGGLKSLSDWTNRVNKYLMDK